MLLRANALSVVYGAGDPCTDYRPPKEAAKTSAAGHDGHERYATCLVLNRDRLRCKSPRLPIGTFP
jgi:hypothetical protein